MADRTPIEWTDATWNVINGCSVVSPGCTNCYAMRLAGTRFRNHPTREGLTTDTKAGPVWNGQVRIVENVVFEPLRWARPRRIFVCAHGDLFHEAVSDKVLDTLFAIMALARQHIFQVLTKRPERMRRYLSDQPTRRRAWEDNAILFRPDLEARARSIPPVLPNVWLGVSAEDHARADERIPILLDTPAAVRWLSAEPLLGPIDLTFISSGPSLVYQPLRGARFDPMAPPHYGDDEEVTARLDWIVAGGESGPGARPMHPDWVRRLRDQCAKAGVPFLFKQWGDWGPVCDVDTDALDDKLYHPAPKGNPDATRRPKTAQLVLHHSGERFEGRRAYDRDAFAAGSGAMLMFNIGKKLAGRRLGGVIHDGFPDVRS